MRTRSLEPEILDVRRVSPGELAAAHRFLARVNRTFGAVRSVIRELERADLGRTRPARVLDVGSGCAELPRAIVRWARKRGRRVHCIALDLDADNCALARSWSKGFGEIAFVRADARALPFADDAFDCVVSSLFLHHLTDDGAVAVLREAGRVGRRLALTDLARSRRLLVWTKLLTAFAGPIVRFDGPLSVRKSFTRGEIDALAQKAGVAWAPARRAFGHRFVLAGAKPS